MDRQLGRESQTEKNNWYRANADNEVGIEEVQERVPDWYSQRRKGPDEHQFMSGGG